MDRSLRLFELAIPDEKGARCDSPFGLNAALEPDLSMPTEHIE